MCGSIERAPRNTASTNPVSSLPVPNGDRHRVTTVALTFGSEPPSWPTSLLHPD
jgi:hypothetical protein